MTFSDPPPVVTRIINKDGRAVGLHNWHSFTRWARRHDPMFRLADDHARKKGYATEDKFKLLVYALTLARAEERTR